MMSRQRDAGNNAVRPSPHPVKPAAAAASPSVHENANSNEPITSSSRGVIVVDRRTFAPNTKNPPHVPSSFDMPRGASAGAPSFGLPQNRPAKGAQQQQQQRKRPSPQRLSPPRSMEQHQQRHFGLDDYDRLVPRSEQLRHIPPRRGGEPAGDDRDEYDTRVGYVEYYRNHHQHQRGAAGGRPIHDSHDPFHEPHREQQDVCVIRDVPRGAEVVKQQRMSIARLSKPKQRDIVVTGQE